MYMHTNIQIQTGTHAYTERNTWICTHIDTIHRHTHILRHTCTDSQRHKHTHTHIYIYTNMHHTQTHRHIHTYIHTYIHTHTNTQGQHRHILKLTTLEETHGIFISFAVSEIFWLWVCYLGLFKTSQETHNRVFSLF